MTQRVFTKMKKSVSDLGKLIKAKNPKYRQYSDEEAGRKLQERYPFRYREFTEIESFDEASSHFDFDYTPERLNKLQVLEDYYNPKRGVFTSWWQRTKSEARTKLQDQLNAEQLSVIQQGIELEHAIRLGKRGEIEFKNFIHQNAVALSQLKNEFTIIEAATNAGFRAENHQDLKTEEARNQITIQMEMARSSIMDMENRAASELRINEHRSMTSIDLSNEIALKNEIVRLSMLAKQFSEHQGLFLIQELIDSTLRQVQEIRVAALDEDVKRRMLEHREEIIDALVKDRRERQDRLFQTNKR